MADASAMKWLLRGDSPAEGSWGGTPTARTAQQACEDAPLIRRSPRGASTRGDVVSSSVRNAASAPARHWPSPPPKAHTHRSDLRGKADPNDSTVSGDAGRHFGWDIEVIKASPTPRLHEIERVVRSTCQRDNRREIAKFSMTCKTLAATVLSISLLILLAETSPVRAQTFRLGYVDINRVLREADIANEAHRRVAEDFDARRNELEREAASLSKDFEKFNADTETSAERDILRQNLSARERALVAQQRDLATAIDRRRAEDVENLVRAVHLAIGRVARQEKFDAIVEDAIYARPELDITQRVLSVLTGRQAN